MNLSGYAFAGVEFDTQGAFVTTSQADATASLASETGTTDVLVISHGWNDDITGAQRLYEGIAASMAQVAGRVPGLAGRTLVIIGVFWPSIAFDTSSLIPGDAGAVMPSPAPASAAQARLVGRLDAVKPFFTRPEAASTLEQAKELVPTLATSPDDRRCFANLVRSLLSASAGDEADADASDAFLTVDGDELISRLAPPSAPAGVPAEAAAPADLSGILHGVETGVTKGVDAIVSGAENVLNLTTFYEMKTRAGTVGQNGVAALLTRLRAAAPNVRIHLAGHSFGARVVTTAANNTAAVLPLSSVSLLQGAFSHYGFAQAWDGVHDGLFRPVVTGHRLHGPMMITHSVHDTALGIAYALASRLPGQFSASAVLGVGGPDDKYGALGANGALKTPESVWGTMQDVGGPYAFNDTGLFDLDGAAYIASHSDIQGPQVAYAVLSAIAYN